MSDLTHSELVYRLYYNPKTGEFTWKNPKANSSKLGNLAGSYEHKGYVIISVNDKRYKAHRLAWFYMTGKWPENQIDHINGNKSDNRWCNLRLASINENVQNRGPLSNNKSGAKNVSFSKNENKWEVTVKKTALLTIITVILMKKR